MQGNDLNNANRKYSHVRFSSCQLSERRPSPVIVSWTYTFQKLSVFTEIMILCLLHKRSFHQTQQNDTFLHLWASGYSRHPPKVAHRSFYKHNSLWCKLIRFFKIIKSLCRRKGKKRLGCLQWEFMMCCCDLWSTLSASTSDPSLKRLYPFNRKKNQFSVRAV